MKLYRIWRKFGSRLEEKVLLTKTARGRISESLNARKGKLLTYINNKGKKLSCPFAWPLLWSSGQSSWLQIQSSGFDSRCYQIFWEVVGLQRGPLSLVTSTEGQLGRRSNGCGLEILKCDRRDPSRWPRGTLYPQIRALTSQTSGGRSISIVRSWAQTTEFSSILSLCVTTVPKGREVWSTYARCL
jgi:hypothetical protein